MNKVINRLLLVGICTVFFACSSNEQYKVSKNRVGVLTAKTTAGDIEQLFKNDSVVKHLSEGLLGFKGAYTQDDDKYLIYSKEGKHLLTITPKEPLDSLSTIRCIDVYDARYQTEQGVGLSSTFEEINMLENIVKIEASFTLATLFLDEINATMTLSKKDLGIKTMNTNPISKQQIPSLVKPTTFVVWFE